MNKQMLTLMVSAVVFATGPAFGTDGGEDEEASPKRGPIGLRSKEITKAEERYAQDTQRRLTLHGRFLSEKVNANDQDSLEKRLKFLEEFFSVESQFQYLLKHTPSDRAQIINEEGSPPYLESAKLLQKIRGEIGTIERLVVLKEKMNKVIQRRGIFDAQLTLHLPKRDWITMIPHPDSYHDDTLREMEDEERAIRKEQIELQRILSGEGNSPD